MPLKAYLKEATGADLLGDVAKSIQANQLCAVLKQLAEGHLNKLGTCI